MSRCPRCGNSSNDVAVWCPACGYPLRPDVAATLSAARGHQPEVVQEYWDRPEGISILGGLTFLSGGFLIFTAVLTLAFAPTVLGGPSAPYTWILIPLMLLFGVVSLFGGWGLWEGKSWAWTLNLVGLSIGTVIYAYQALHDLSNILGSVIDLLTIYYLFQPHVKGYFGKGSVPRSVGKEAAAAA